MTLKQLTINALMHVSYHALYAAMTPMSAEQWAYFGFFAQEMSRQVGD